MNALQSTIRLALRGQGSRGDRTDSRRTALWLAACVVLFGSSYGAVMGSFVGWEGERALQVLASALKVPFLLLATLSLSLPSFFVLNTLLGVREDFGQAVRAVLASQAAFTIVLASMAPIVGLWYVSSSGYRAAILFNAAMFAVASVGAQIRLRRSYSPLIARKPVHRTLLRAWLFLFAMIGIQMGWLLRPFIGDPNQPFQLFRENAWGNAYVIVGGMIWEQLSRLG